MPGLGYRLFLDDAPATAAQTARVEAITVEQEVDMAWEARLEIPIGTDSAGRWSGEEEDLGRPFARVRIEVLQGDGAWRPLIDGPVAGAERRLGSEPGQSLLVVRLRDDSTTLDRTESFAIFEGRLDHEIAGELFGESANIASQEIEPGPAPPGGEPATVVRRGTAMALLRRLARRNGKHAYVLPGDEPGASTGCFKAFTNESDGLPDLVLTGSSRNLQSLTVMEDSLRPAVYSGQVLPFGDSAATAGQSSLEALDRLGAELALADSGQAAQLLLPVNHPGWRDPATAAAAESERSTYAFEASGEVQSERYGQALTPYRIVRVRGINGRLSGDWLITSVTHRLNRSAWTQSIGLRRNARSEGAGGGGGLLSAVF